MVKCIIPGCEGEGRKIGALSGVELYYCNKHEKVGQRILDFLILSSDTRNKRNCLKQTRKSILCGSLLCEECSKKVLECLNETIKQKNES